MLPITHVFQKEPRNQKPAREPSDATNQARFSYADEMAGQLDFKDTNLSEKKEHAILALINKIPLLSGFISSVSGTDETFSKLAQINRHISQASQTANSASVVTNLTLGVVNFIRIPILFFAAYLVGEKLPLTLTHRAEWLYSAVLLGLTITALAAPITAPVIAFVFVGLGLGVSLVTMGKSLYQRYKLRTELKTIDNEIAINTSTLNALRKETTVLQKELSHAILHEDICKAGQIAKQLDVFKDKFDRDFESKSDKLKELYNKKIACEKKLKEIGFSALMMKGVGVLLSALAVTGLVLCLFLPPVGLSILAAASLAGLTLMVGQLIVPFFKGLMSASKDKGKAPIVGDESLEGKSSANQHCLSEETTVLHRVLDNQADALPKPDQRVSGSSDEAPDAVLKPPCVDDDETVTQVKP